MTKEEAAKAIKDELSGLTELEMEVIEEVIGNAIDGAVAADRKAAADYLRKHGCTVPRASTPCCQITADAIEGGVHAGVRRE